MIPPQVTPPCMEAIIADLAAGKNVGHSARFAVASFAVSAGIGVDGVIKLFERTPNFSPEKSRKIVEQMVDRQYAPPNCERMKAEGLCCNQVPLCHSIQNPVSFLRARRGDAAHQAPAIEKPQPLMLYSSMCSCNSFKAKPLPPGAARVVSGGHLFAVPEGEDAMHNIEYFDLNGQPAKPWLTPEWEA